MSNKTKYVEVEAILRFERRDSGIEFPKPTESAKDVADYYEFIRADESKELAQKIFDELVDMKVNHYHIVWIKEVFERHGIKQVDKTTNL